MKPLHIYVASSWRNTYQPEVVEQLRSLGNYVYDFKGPGSGWGSYSTEEGPGGFGWSEVDRAWQTWPDDVWKYMQGLNHPRVVAGFNRDMDALKLADACVMVMPCGPSASMEMGWACGAGKPTVVYIPAMREPDLMVKMANLITDEFAQVAAYIQGLRKS